MDSDIVVYNLETACPLSVVEGSSCILARHCSCFSLLLWNESPTVSPCRGNYLPLPLTHICVRFKSILISAPHVHKLALFSLTCMKQHCRHCQSISWPLTIPLILLCCFQVKVHESEESIDDHESFHDSLLNIEKWLMIMKQKLESFHSPAGKWSIEGRQHEAEVCVCRHVVTVFQSVIKTAKGSAMFWLITR